MKKLLVPFCLTLIIFIGSVGVSESGTVLEKGSIAYQKKDYATALREFKPFAEQGNADAQYFLGTMYANGRGVPKNYKTAMKWYKLAAKQGDSSAQYSLGWVYYNGEGVKKSNINAYIWWSKAADQGDRSAKRLILQVAKEMTPSQLKKVKVLARGNIDKKKLSKFYQQYMYVKECNKINSAYISRNDLKTAKRAIKTIEKMFKKDNKNLNTDAIWNSASKTFDKDMGGAFALMKLGGGYQPQMKATCRMPLMVLSSVPSEKGNNTRKKDF